MKTKILLLLICCFISSTEAQTDKNSLILILDVSGSMSGERITELKKAAKTIVEKTVNDCNQIAIIAYESDIYDLQNFTANKENLTNFINNLSSGGGTNTALAISKAYDMVIEQQKINPNNHYSAILLSDGYGSGDYQGIISKYSQKVNLKINTLGFEIETNGEEQLIDISKLSNGEYYESFSGELTNSFSQIVINSVSVEPKKEVKIETKIDFNIKINGDLKETLQNFWSVEKVVWFSHPDNPRNLLCNEDCLHSLLNDYKQYPSSLYINDNKLFFYYALEKSWKNQKFNIKNNVLSFDIDEYYIELQLVYLDNGRMNLCLKYLEDTDLDEIIIQSSCDEYLSREDYQIILYFKNLKQCN